MTIIFPEPHDPVLSPYLEPFARMMFGYGRAMVALREIAQAFHDSEREAVEFMSRCINSKTMVKEFRKLCEPTFQPEQLAQLLELCATLADLHRRRNRIVHGEWWFNPFDGGGLRIRDWDKDVGAPVHDETVTPELLDQLANEFDAVSRELAILIYIKKTETPERN